MNANNIIFCFPYSFNLDLFLSTEKFIISLVFLDTPPQSRVDTKW